MTTVVKLSTAEARAYSLNQPQWVSPEGLVVRNVTPEEETVISASLVRVRKIQKSGRQTLHVERVVGQDSKGRNITRREPTDVRFEVIKVNQTGGIDIQIYLDGNRRVSGKEIMSAKLLAEHGECIIHGRNGKMVGVIRDPNLKQRSAVLSETKGGISKARLESGEQLRQAANARQRVLEEEKKAAVVHTYKPQECPNDCRGLRGGQAYALAKGSSQPKGQHHPMCQHAAAWAEISQSMTGPVAVLYDLERGRASRVATADEVRAAVKAKAATGAPSVNVGGRIFAVIDRSLIDDRGRLIDEAAAGAPSIEETLARPLSDSDAPIDPTVVQPAHRGISGTEEIARLKARLIELEGTDKEATADVLLSEPPLSKEAEVAVLLTEDEPVAPLEAEPDTGEPATATSGGSEPETATEIEERAPELIAALAGPGPTAADVPMLDDMDPPPPVPVQPSKSVASHLARPSTIAEG